MDAERIGRLCQASVAGSQDAGDEALLEHANRVVAAGSGKSKDDGKRVPLDVKAGDLILFGKYSGQEIKLDGEEFLIMREDEVLAVIDEKKKK